MTLYHTQYYNNCDYAASAARISHAGPISSTTIFGHESQWIITGSNDYYFSYGFYYE
jgi:hypothetical protein